MDPIAAKYIGAGIACIGMGGAGVGVGIDLRQLPRRRAAQPVGRAGPVRQPDLRLRRDRSARHLLAADRAAAAVRALRQPSRGDDGRADPHREHRTRCAGRARAISALPAETFASQLCGWRSLSSLLYVLMAQARAAARRRDHRGAGRSASKTICRGIARMKGESDAARRRLRKGAGRCAQPRAGDRERDA